MKLLDPRYPWLPWPIKCEWNGGSWSGFWHEYQSGPGLRNRFWAIYSVIMYRLIGRRIDYPARGYVSPRWYEWLYHKGWNW